MIQEGSQEFQKRLQARLKTKVEQVIQGDCGRIEKSQFCKKYGKWRNQIG